MKHYIFDAHQDISDALLYSTHGDFWRKNGLHEGWNDIGLPVNNQTDIVRLKKGRVAALFAVSCVVAVDKEGHIIPHPSHFEELLNHIDLYDRLVKEGKGSIQVIKSVNDLEKIGDYPLSFLLAVECADSIDNDLKNLQILFDRGVRSIGLTYNHNNVLAGGCTDDGELTSLGKKTIRKMEGLGIVLDLSHINEKSFYQAIAVSKKPVIVSHAACMAIHNHARNITDDQMKKVAETGGVVGICGVPKFIGEMTVEAVAEHFLHAIEAIGIKHVIVGSDFGAMTAEELIPNFAQVSDLPKLLKILREKGLSQNDIDLLCHKNIERVLSQTLPK